MPVPPSSRAVFSAASSPHTFILLQQQAALKARNKTVQVEEEAKQKLVTAKAEAEAISIRAKALAENKDVVILNAIEKWDGKAPQTLSIGAGNMFLPAK